MPFSNFLIKLSLLAVHPIREQRRLLNVRANQLVMSEITV